MNQQIIVINGIKPTSWKERFLRDWLLLAGYGGLKQVVEKIWDRLVFYMWPDVQTLARRWFPKADPELLDDCVTDTLMWARNHFRLKPGQLTAWLRVQIKGRQGKKINRLAQLWTGFFPVCLNRSAPKRFSFWKIAPLTSGPGSAAGRRNRRKNKKNPFTRTAGACGNN